MSGEPLNILAFGAHPDDIEFGCGGVIARETRAGAGAHFVICSRGESASNGTPEQRMREADEAASLLGATMELVELDGDGRLRREPRHAVTLAGIIRRQKPAVVLATTPVGNQHPDHARLGEIVRDAVRLARYGGVAELKGQPPHAVGAIFYYAVAAEGEMDGLPVLVDVSGAGVMKAWRAAMEAHASQGATRSYAELQLARARVWGMRAGVEYAIPLWANDPIVVESISQVARGARRF